MNYIYDSCIISGKSQAISLNCVMSGRLKDVTLYGYAQKAGNHLFTVKLKDKIEFTWDDDHGIIPEQKENVIEKAKSVFKCSLKAKVESTGDIRDINDVRAFLKLPLLSMDDDDEEEAIDETIRAFTIFVDREQSEDQK